MNRHRRHALRTRIVFLACALILATSTGQTQRSHLRSETARLIELLRLEPDSAVADLGAGSGEVSVELARQLGTEARVFSSDINPERLREIDTAVRGAGLKNVTVVEGHATETNLPDACCDALFVRHVYHHFADPAAMNAGIRRALKPGGRFAVMDFPPRKPGTGRVPPAARASGDTHGVTMATVVEELEEAGFEILQTIPEWPGGLFCVLAVNPGP